MWGEGYCSKALCSEPPGERGAAWTDVCCRSITLAAAWEGLHVNQNGDSEPGEKAIARDQVREDGGLEKDSKSTGGEVYSLK